MAATGTVSGGYAGRCTAGMSAVLRQVDAEVGNGEKGNGGVELRPSLRVSSISARSSSTFSFVARRSAPRSKRCTGGLFTPKGVPPLDPVHHHLLPATASSSDVRHRAAGLAG